MAREVTLLIPWTSKRRAEKGVIVSVDGDKQPRLTRAHVDEHKQEEKQRYHRNEELPAQTSFVTPASPAPGAASAGRRVAVPLGMQVFICSRSLPGAIGEN